MHSVKLRPAAASDADVRVIMDALRQIVQALRLSARAAERDLRISGAQLFVLHRLAQAPASSINDLAARTFTHQSSVSVVVKRLAARGLVTRLASRDDARQVRIALTAKGRALLRRAPEAAQARLIAGILQQPATRRRNLARLLATLVRAVGEVPHPPELFFEDAPRPARRTRSHTS